MPVETVMPLYTLSGAALTIRPARDAEARACRMLLPDMFLVDQAPEALIATVGRPGQPGMLAGALGLGSVRLAPDGALPMQVQVIPSLRRQGIARALVDMAVQRCAGRTTVLRALRPVAAEGEAALFMAATGFTRHDTIRHFETDTAAFHAMILSVRRRLEQTGRVPAQARVLRLRDAPAAAVAELVSRHFPVTAAAVRARLDPHTSHPYALDESVAVLLADRLVGALIFVWNGKVPIIEVRVVDPSMRGGWVNTLLLEEATRSGMAAGSVRFRFFADERVADTMSLARRAQAMPIGSELHFWRPIG